MRIVFLDDFVQRVAWRQRVLHCPHCEKEPPAINDWMNARNVMEVALSSKAYMAKTQSVKVSSECPGCFEKSWVHASFSYLESCLKLNPWPREAEARIEAEKKKRVAAGERRWRSSLCRKCTINKEVSWDCLYPYVSCEAGHHQEATGECKDFKSAKKDARRVR